MTADILAPAVLDREPKTRIELLARRALVCRQVREIWAARDVYGACPCGSRISVVKAFKCRECHILFCGPCALRHFGLKESEMGRWWIETDRAAAEAEAPPEIARRAAPKDPALPAGRAGGDPRHGVSSGGSAARLWEGAGTLVPAPGFDNPDPPTLSRAFGVDRAGAEVKS